MGKESGPAESSPSSISLISNSLCMSGLEELASGRAAGHSNSRTCSGGVAKQETRHERPTILGGKMIRMALAPLRGNGYLKQNITLYPCQYDENLRR